MLKKTITYTNFNDQKVSEDFFFHLSKADLIEMEVSKKGGMQQYLQNIVASEDGSEIIAEMKKIILSSYGKKSDDGRRFIKSEELRQEFVSTEAYSQLFLELCTDAGAAAAFINGIIPNDLAQDVSEITDKIKEPGVQMPEPVEEVEDEPRVISREEAVAMNPADLMTALNDGAKIAD